MASPDLQKVLTEIGLSDNEAAVYFAALSLGPSSVAKIARSAEIKRTTAYSVIESLQQRGLIRIELRGFKRFFAAENPDRLDSILESRRRLLSNALPEFSALFNLKGGESFIKHYEGLEAMKGVYDGLIEDVRPHEDYLIVSDVEKWHALAPEYFDDFTLRRAKLPINIRLLLMDVPMARELQKTRERLYNYTIRLLPKDTELTTNLVVIPKKVVIHQLVPPIFAMVIESQHIVRMFMELFKIAWNSLPRD